ncbi:RNA-binding protein 1 [Trachymyrmex septentrionalis]|uniref:RNA-binding protein 1 n=1 Tax=Trachymyrmex septentrionalis TaxID=34720 RepID=A0A195FLU5_9HYME|nr:RNA-binding protein 1 [Trachymyrmex septentrionalis]
MSRYREWDLSCKVYVGNLGSSASKHEIESAFSKYGPLRNVWVARNPPGFAFVEFEDPRDAEDAVRGLDGTRCCGTRVRVEMSSGRSRRGGGGRRPGPRYSRSRSRSPRRKSLGRYPRSWSRSPQRASISRYSRNRFRYLLCHRSLCKRSKFIIGKTFRRIMDAQATILPASAPSSARLPATTTTTTSTTTTTTATTTSTAAVIGSRPYVHVARRCCALWCCDVHTAHNGATTENNSFRVPSPLPEYRQCPRLPPSEKKEKRKHCFFSVAVPLPPPAIVHRKKPS